MKATFPPLLALCLLALAVTPASGHSPPSDEEVKKLKERGIYEERLRLVESMGNDSFSPPVFERAKGKLVKTQLQAQGLSAEQIEQTLPHLAPPPEWVGLPTTGTPRVPTILIEFPDQRASTLFPAITPSAVYANIYGAGTPAAQNHMPFNSVSDYYRRASHNKLDIRGNVLGFLTMPNNQLTYAPLNAQPDNQKLFDIVTTALRAFDATHDFSQYDNNNDGYIDGINIIYVGQGGEWSSFWWAYRWRFFVPGVETTLFDGKKLSWFTWQRLDTRDGGTDFDPQTLIHETGHLLGMPDLYDYKRGEGLEGGVGGLDVMDANRGNPNAFFRWMMDWITPEIASAGAPSVRSLSASGDLSTDQNKAVAIFPDILGSPFQEMFIVENRHRVGNDGGESFMPSNGLVAWHVDATLNAAGTNFQFNNTDRTPSPHKMIKLMQADGLEQIEVGGRADAGDYYNQGESLTPTSTPNTRSHANVDTGISIDNISPDGLLMTAEIGFLGQGGQPDLRDGGAGSHGLSHSTRQPGDTLTISGQVENGGTAASGGFTVSFYASTDATISTSDRLLGQRALAGIPAGASAALDHAVTIPGMPNGSYRIGWIIDSTAGVNESDESNNIVVIAPQLEINGVAMPNLEVRGAGFVIVSGDTLPRPDDGTDFGSAAVGGEVLRSYGMINNGTADLNGVSVALGGPGAGDFAILGTPPASVAAGGASPVTLAFRPLAPGLKAATVMISSSDPDTPSYTFAIQGSAFSTNDDHGNTLATATPVAVPSATAGVLENGGDNDYFSFTLAQAGTVTVATSGPTDTFGRLLAANGTVVQENDDDGPGLNFAMTSFLQPGTWVVRVTGYDNSVTGSYQLELSFTAGATDDHGGTLATATPANLNSLVAGTLETAGDVDMFRLNLTKQGILTLESNGTTDTFGRILDGNGLQIASNDDGGVDRNFRFLTNLAAGTYYLVVEGYAHGVTGTYSVSIGFTEQVPKDDHGNDIFSATQVAPYSVTPGALETGGDIDVFAVTVASPGLFVFYTTGTTDTYGSLSPLEDDDTGPGTNFLIEAYLPSAGTYHVVVQGFDGSTIGDYTLFSHFVPFTSSFDDHRNGPHETLATLMAPNGTAGGTLGLAGDTDFFRIDLTQAGTLTVSTSGGTDTYGFLHDGNGDVIVGDDDSGPGTNFRIGRAVAAGTYYVRVEGYDLTATGTYTFTSSFVAGTVADDHGNSVGAATAVDVPSNTAGNLETGGDLDFFVFSLAETSQVSLSTTGATDTFGTLFHGNGSEIFSNDDRSASDTNFLIGAMLEPGTYAVRIRGYSASTTGAYTLHIEATAVAPPADFRVMSFERLSATSFHISFQGEAGFSYTIERSDNLENWTPVLSDLTGSGLIEQAFSLVPAGDRCFVRIRRN